MGFIVNRTNMTKFLLWIGNFELLEMRIWTLPFYINSAVTHYGSGQFDAGTSKIALSHEPGS